MVVDSSQVDGHKKKWTTENRSPNIKLEGPSSYQIVYFPDRLLCLWTVHFLRPVILDHVVENYFSIKTFLLNFKSEIILSANIIIIFLRIKWFYLFGLRIEN